MGFGWSDIKNAAKKALPYTNMMTAAPMLGRKIVKEAKEYYAGPEPEIPEGAAAVDPSLAATSERAQQYRDMLMARQEALAGRAGPEQVGVSPYQVGSMSQVAGPEAATLQMDPTSQARSAQVMEMLRARAAGEAGPSAAEMQMQQGQEAIRRQMLSAAAGARGGQVGASLQAQQGQMAQASQQAAAQAGILRAQEQAQAEQVYASAASEQARQDLARAQTEAGFQQQSADLAARMAQERAAQEFGATTQAGLQQQQLGTQTQMFNVQQQQEAQRQKDLLMTQYLQMGMSAEEADRAAQMQVAAMQHGQAMDIYGAQTAARNKREQDFMSYLQAGATMGGAMMGGPAGAQAGSTAANFYGSAKPSEPFDPYAEGIY